MKLDVDAALSRVGFGRFQWITLLLSGVGFGATTVELVAVAQFKPFVQRHWNVATSDLGWITTTLFAGEVVGGLFWGHVSDRIGRERAFLATSVLMAVSSALLVTSGSFMQFCMWRLVLGFGIGGGLGVDFVYFIECVPSKSRSFRTSFIVLVGIFGLIYSALAGLLCLDAYDFRVFLLVCALPSLGLMLGRFCWRYESPKYLAERGRSEDAKRVLLEMARMNGRALTEKDFVMREEEDGKATRFDVPRLPVSVALASVIFFCQTSAYYGLTMWLSFFSRGRSFTPSLMLLAVGIAEIPGLAVVSCLLRCYPQRARLLLAGSFAIMSVLCGMLHRMTTETELLVVFCALYFFIVSVWTIIYAHIPGTFPTARRSRCFAIAGTFGKLGGMIGSHVFSWMWGRSLPVWMIYHVAGGLFLVGAAASLLF